MQDNTTTAQHLDGDYLVDPYTLCRRLRVEAPVTEVIMPRGTHGWLITRYDDVRAALADKRLAKDAARLSELFERNNPDRARERESPSAEDAGVLDQHMLNSDPPDHERLRRLVTKAFTARRIEQLRPRVQEITDQLLAEITTPEVDLLDAFAFPLPITVICELLGMSLEERDNVRRWTITLLGSSDDQDVVEAAVQNMIATMAKLIAEKRDNPGDDMLSALVEARDEGDRLSERELSAMVFLLLVAGHETTVNLIANGTLALINHPDEMAALRADMSLLPGAIEEFLRYQGPLNHATFRFSAEELEIGGVTIPADQFVIVSLSSANRDERRFDDPDRLDIRRDTGGHLAFGHGIHYCLGAQLARLEAEIAFTGLLTRFPKIELAVPVDELQWRPGMLIRGLERFPVKLG